MNRCFSGPTDPCSVEGQRKMSGEFVISLILSCHSKNSKWQMDQCYNSVLLGKQGKIHPQGVRAGWPKRHEEKRGEAQFWLLLLFVFLFFPWACPAWTGLARRLFASPKALTPVLDLPLLYFCRLFPSLSFSCLHSGLLCPILTLKKVSLKSSFFFFKCTNVFKNLRKCLPLVILIELPYIYSIPLVNYTCWWRHYS